MSPLLFFVPRNGHIAEYFSECALSAPPPPPRDCGVQVDLTADEQAELLDEADGMPVGDYIRHLLFEDD